MQRHTQRRWRIPPLPERGLEAADGAALLNEDVSGLGVFLWDMARDTALWAATPGAHLDEIFAPALERMRMPSVVCAPPHPLLTQGLENLGRMTREPRLISRRLVGLSCRMIARWADDRGAVGTAYVFAHAAAVTCAGDARLSYDAGRLARRRADYGRAEEWLKRAVLLGRRFGDWDSCINARGGLGNLYIQRGNYPRAERHHLRALGLARRHGLRDLQGHALHSLCVIVCETHRMEDLNAYAREACKAFGEEHPRLPTLAHDVAYGWMRQGYFARALEVFEAARPHFRRDQYVIVLGNICRSAAGAGYVERFESAWKETRNWIANDASQEYVAQALLDLAQGAATLSRWEMAEEAAISSLQIATARQEGRVQLSAEALLDSVRHEHAVQVTTVTHDAEIMEEVNVLADEFVESLAGFAGTGV